MKEIKNIFYKLPLLSAICLCTFLCATSGAEASFLRFTKIIPTNEGVITKVIYDGANPANYPLQLFLLACIIIVIVNLFRHPEVYMGKPREKTTTITMKEMLSGKKPVIIKDTENALFNVVEKIRETDENFSLVRFLAFVIKYYETTLPFRASGEWGRTSYYTLFHVIQKLKKWQKSRAHVRNHNLVSCELVNVESFNAGTNKIVVDITETHDENNESGSKIQVIQAERWTFERFKGVLSEAPNQPIEFDCPVCQDNAGPDIDGICPKCNKEVTNGRYSWIATSVDVKTINSAEHYPRAWRFNYTEGCARTTIQSKLSTKMDQLNKRQKEAINWDNTSKTALNLLTSYYRYLFSDKYQTLVDILAPCLYHEVTFLRSSVLEMQPEFEIVNVTSTDTLLVRVDPDPFYDIATFRIWGYINSSVLGKEKPTDPEDRIITVKNYFSDYITIFKEKEQSENDWKILWLDREGLYKP